MLLLTAGCAYMGTLTRQWHAAFSGPSQVLTQQTSPDRCRVVYGRVLADSSERCPWLVAAVSLKYGSQEVVDAYQMSRPGYYSLYLPDGEYRVLVFADVNHDSLFEATECAAESLVSVDFDSTGPSVLGALDLSAHSGVLKQLDIPFTRSLRPERGLAVSRYYPPGAIRSIDDEIFSEKNGILGLYNPAAFLQNAGGYFYALSERDMRKTPIIFVHGITGTPQNWRTVVKNIDLTRFDPWFFYYPSGEKLDKVADIMFEIFFSGHIIELHRREAIVIAHSMGGLVARAAINKYAQSGRDDFLKLYISICTPYAGNESASAGVRKAPVVIPAWYDVSTGSQFLTDLYKTPLPQWVDFRLFFAFHNDGTFGGSSDGTIELSSQLDPRAQFAARDIYGFNETHTSVLESPDVLRKINEILAEY
jgi:pimeloyl-ACP methyl ester carboxylesterase